MDMSLNLATSAEEVSTATSRIQTTIGHITDGIVSQDEQVRHTEGELASLLETMGRIRWEANRGATAAESTVKAVDAGAAAMNRSLDQIGSISARAEETYKTVRSLSEASERIDTVLRWIEDIAARVNVLALNAQIEATRAGESGRGFRVVSDEIRGLSKGTAKAVTEVGQLLGSIRQGVQGVERAVADEIARMRDSRSVTDEARATLSGIGDTLSENQDRMRRIAASIAQVQDFSDRVHNAVKAVSKVSARNAQSLQEIQSAAEALNVQFRDVADLAKRLETMSRGEQELLAKFALRGHEN
jgi:methyl-accepting chemotaxis protein